MARAKNYFVKFDPKESSEKRVSRLKQWFNCSRVGNLVKSRRYRDDKRHVSKRKVRGSALIREKYRAERERKKYYL